MQALAWRGLGDTPVTSSFTEGAAFGLTIVAAVWAAFSIANGLRQGQERLEQKMHDISTQMQAISSQLQHLQERQINQRMDRTEQALMTRGIVVQTVVPASSEPTSTSPSA